MRKRHRKFLNERTVRKGTMFGVPILFAGLLLTISVTHGAVIAAAIKDPQSIFSQRSPGERRTGKLADAKPAPSLRTAFTTPPRERVLSGTRERPNPTGLPAIVIPEAAPAFPLADVVAPQGVPADSFLAPASALPNSPFISAPPGAGSGPSAPGGSGPPGVPEEETPDIDTPGTPGGPLTPEIPVGPVPPDVPEQIDVPGAIPEPATWIMNIIGMFAVGGMMRRRRVSPDVNPLSGRCA